MRIIVSLALSSMLLSGCAVALVGEAAIAEGGLAAEATSAEAATAGGVEGASARVAGMSRISIASDLYDIGAERGVLSETFDRITANGTRPASVLVERNTGILRGDGRILGRLDQANGDLLTPNGQKAGYLSASDARIYEITNANGTRAIAELQGFVARNGVELLSSADGTTVVRILRPSVTVDVLAMRNGMYLVRLVDGTEGLIPASVIDLSLLGLAALATGCSDNDGGGAMMRQSGETYLYSKCEPRDHAFVLTTTNGVTVVDADDVKSVRPTGQQASENLNQLRETSGRHSGFATYTAALLMTRPRSDWMNSPAFIQAAAQRQFVQSTQPGLWPERQEIGRVPEQRPEFGEHRDQPQMQQAVDQNRFERRQAGGANDIGWNQQQLQRPAMPQQFGIPQRNAFGRFPQQQVYRQAPMFQRPGQAVGRQQGWPRERN